MRRFRTATRDVELAGRTIRLLMPANADDLISEDDFVRDERLPYWADLWPSARILAEELAVMRLRGQRVLELGCGLGFVAIGAVMGGADVTATDYYEDATRFALVNVAEATGTLIDDAHGELGRHARGPRQVRRRASRRTCCTSTATRRWSRTPSPRRCGGAARRSWPIRAGSRCRSSSTSAAGSASSTRAIRVPSSTGEIRQTVTLWKMRWTA